MPCECRRRFGKPCSGLVKKGLLRKFSERIDTTGQESGGGSSEPEEDATPSPEIDLNADQHTAVVRLAKLLARQGAKTEAAALERRAKILLPAPAMR